jgi:3-hydroxymyristoyl/3-hydroxydecanoyl-(acyl carrier protein) dehydratase
MAFHFVDRIYEYTPFKSIRGLKNVTRNESLFYWLPNGQRVLSPAVVTEALCQLGGWLKMVSTDFERRPVLLADEKTEYLGLVEAGDQIDLHVEVMDFGDDVIVTKGSACVRGEKVLVGHCCRGYLLPLSDFDDPNRVRKQFNALYKPGFEKFSRVGAEATKLKALAGTHTFEALRFIDGILVHKPYEQVVGYKNFAACEPYFESHFPLKPCVPGVLLLTFMGEVCQYLVKEQMEAPLRSRALVPTYIQNVRFRKFVEPGDQCVLEAKIMSGDPKRDNSDILVKAVIMANDNRVMQAEMGFRTMFAETTPKIERRLGAVASASAPSPLTVTSSEDSVKGFSKDSGLKS